MLPEEISLSTLDSLINFIYTGEVEIPEEELNELIEAAESLDIRGLTEKPPPPSTNEVKDGPELVGVRT